MSATMGVRDTKFILKYLPVEMSVLLIADPGVGKSEVVKQVAQEMNIPCIDFRLSQNDVGDIKGMPLHIKGRTMFAPPDWFPLSEGDEIELGKLLGSDNVSPSPYGDQGILFLDEPNRAERDVRNAAFELILDRRLNLRSLPVGWRVVCAVNGDADVCNDISIMDVAFVQRFFTINFHPTHDEFLNYEKKREMHNAVYEFLNQRRDLIDPPKALLKQTAVDGITKIHDRRSWEKLSDAILEFERKYKEGKLNFDIFNFKENGTFLKQFVRGQVGASAGDEFTTYIETNYRVLDGNIILNKWDRNSEEYVKNLLENGSLTELSRYNDMIIEWINENVDKNLSEKQSNNLFFYLTALSSKELHTDFWKKFQTECKEISSLWLDSNQKYSDLLLDAFMLERNL